MLDVRGGESPGCLQRPGLHPQESVLPFTEVRGLENSRSEGKFTSSVFTFCE